MVSTRRHAQTAYCSSRDESVAKILLVQTYSGFSGHKLIQRLIGLDLMEMALPKRGIDDLPPVNPNQLLSRIV